jgi:hypothetical protein
MDHHGPDAIRLHGNPTTTGNRSPCARRSSFLVLLDTHHRRVRRIQQSFPHFATSENTSTQLGFDGEFPATFRPATGMFPDCRATGNYSIRRHKGVSQYQICKGLPCGKGLATHRRVDGLEDAQSMDIRNAANGERIAQILNLALRIGERRPRGKARAIWIVPSREVDPVAGHLLSQLPITLDFLGSWRNIAHNRVVLSANAC